MATINFYLDKPDKKGFAPIHLRINCNGSQVKVSTGQKIESKKFNKSKQKAIGLGMESQEINHYLVQMGVMFLLQMVKFTITKNFALS